MLRGGGEAPPNPPSRMHSMLSTILHQQAAHLWLRLGLFVLPFLIPVILVVIEIVSVVELAALASRHCSTESMCTSVKNMLNSPRIEARNAFRYSKG